jgi:hypothetical protein
MCARLMTGEEIRELEGLLLVIFRYKIRIKLANEKSGSGALIALRKASCWREAEGNLCPSREKGNSYSGYIGKAVSIGHRNTSIVISDEEVIAMRRGRRPDIHRRRVC